MAYGVDTLQEHSARYVREVFRATRIVRRHGSKRQACRVLGITNTTLNRYLRLADALDRAADDTREVA